MASNQPSTEQAFRANLSQFRWANSVQDDSQQQQPQSSNPFARFYNAVGGGYIPLRSSERSNEEEAYFALSRWDRYVLKVVFSPPRMRIISPSSYVFCRLIGFGACLLGAAVCFFVAFLTAPFIPIRPEKFALALRCVPHPCPFPSQTAFSCFLRSSLGSILVMFGFVERFLYTFQPLTKLAFCSFAVLVGPITHLKHLVSKERLPFSAAYIASLVLTIYFSVSASLISP